MKYQDDLIEHYSPVLEGSYDCIDRLTINAYNSLLHTAAGLRYWFRKLEGGDSGLNTSKLMRFAGRFSRRVREYCKSRGIHFQQFKSGERKHEVAEMLIPEDPNYEGIFAIFLSKAPQRLWEVKEFPNGSINIRKKKGSSWCNHFFFHIMDSEWGHITIRICSHPPFNALVILNGHEWVERRDEIKALKVTKVDNCFTAYNDGQALSRTAETVKRKGRLGKVCDRWIYRCLWFGLDEAEQKRSGFRYNYSLYQVEYSRNLLFERGVHLDRVYQHIIDLTRGNLDIARLKTIFGRKNRPYNRKTGRSGFEVRIERPDYNLTIFKIHFGKITVKLYDKGERTLRAEIVVHNTKALKEKRSVENFGRIVQKLQAMMKDFMNNLLYAHVSMVEGGILENLTTPSKKGKARLAGLDIAKERTLAIMEAVLALSVKPGGFTSADVAAKMKKKMGPDYSTRKASYDIKKLRGKEIVVKQKRSIRYRITKQGAQRMIAILALVRRQIPTALSVMEADQVETGEKIISDLEQHYLNLRKEVKDLAKCYGGIEAA